MAAIDKIYGFPDQYEELYQWCLQNLSEALPYFYPRGYFFEDDGEPKKKAEPGPISNFPLNIDIELFKRCPLEWVRERLREQYPSSGRTL